MNTEFNKIQVNVSMAKMQRTAFNDLLQRQIFAVMIACNEKAFQLEYRKRHCDTRLVVNDGRRKYIVDAGICEIKFSVINFSNYSSQGLLYYRWSPDDDHMQIVNAFGEHLWKFYAKMFPTEYDTEFVFPFSACTGSAVM